MSARQLVGCDPGGVTWRVWPALRLINLIRARSTSWLAKADTDAHFEMLRALQATAAQLEDNVNIRLALEGLFLQLPLLVER